jgi:hypothetical protein
MAGMQTALDVPAPPTWCDAAAIACPCGMAFDAEKRRLESSPLRQGATNFLRIA